jgi:hypothetical protein
MNWILSHKAETLEGQRVAIVRDECETYYAAIPAGMTEAEALADYLAGADYAGEPISLSVEISEVYDPHA